MCAPKESGSAPNPEISAENDPMPEYPGPATSSKQAIGESGLLPGNADWIDFASDEGTLYIIKAADSRRRPKGIFFGKAELESALKSGSEERWLLYVIVPNGSRGLRLRYAAGGREIRLDDPRMIYRMPNSPLYTFVVVDLKSQGRLEAQRDGKTIGNLDLAGASASLAAMPLHWNQKTGTVSFQGLPALLNGKMAD